MITWNESLGNRRIAFGSGYRRYIIASLVAWALGLMFAPFIVIVVGWINGKFSPGNEIRALLAAATLGVVVRGVVEVLPREIIVRPRDGWVSHIGRGRGFLYDSVRITTTSVDVLTVEFRDCVRNTSVRVGASTADELKIRSGLAEMQVSVEDSK